MIIEQPPLLFRILFSETVWRIHRKRRTVFLTFDDGPIPKVTPWVLDTLDHYGVKATFFLVGDNVRRHPELLEEILRRGHSVGNHTMNHLQSIKVTTRTYLRNVALADRLIGSRLFRPPHGLLRWGTARLLKNHFSLIMYDLVTRDYNQKLTGEEVLNNVKQARINISNRELMIEDSKKSLYKEIQKAYFDASAAQKKYQASDKAVAASQQAFTYAQQRYSAGKSNVFEFNEAKTKYAQSMAEQSQAKYEFIFRAKILDFYNGTPIHL